MNIRARPIKFKLVRGTPYQFNSMEEFRKEVFKRSKKSFITLMYGIEMFYDKYQGDLELEYLYVGNVRIY